MELSYANVQNPNFVTLIYGTCETEDPDGPFGMEGGTCSPPLQLPIQPLCSHLGAVARAPVWRARRIRGAPVGTMDGAAVLFTDNVQVKVYRGQGTGPGVELRALEALRSANSVEPVIEPGDPIAGPPLGLLERGSC